ncbi:MAG: helix-turn-helix transcriptional regulator [Clostridiales bacterium]|nr:helix-turn-helix transcriptional regulator [Clostridiales bacterium]
MLENLKKLRQEKGISQKQLADVVSVSQQSINKYENHSVEPDIETMIRIADYFDTSVDYLIGHSEVNRRCEQVQPHDLNECETELIEDFRKLTEKQRNAVKAVIKSYQQ